MKSRPVNLALHTLRFPVTAIVSILHRISGLVLFLLVPVLLYALQQLMHAPQSASMSGLLLASGCAKFFVWAFLAGLFYHSLAGLRHVLMDMGLFFSKCGAMTSARFVILLGLIIAALLALRIFV